ncbi:hypothetical protein TSUD_317140 [Trifolium subterraneum]|uniref:Uncharacterized protein n=1 Tax=Trifolium subterraneum TaxID=3900 RepID=A0A2Z6NRB5_TRISU|nr:hypothetical protein TSUD_317140 [Trifolium subterraneum]
MIFDASSCCIGSGGDSVVPLAVGRWFLAVFVRCSVQRDRACVGVWFFAGSTFVMVWCLVFAPACCDVVVTGVEVVCVGHIFPFLLNGTTAECQYLSRVEFRAPSWLLLAPTSDGGSF